ncbi:RTA1 like protein-domain-containing protein [Epithele typhae]|uniref:RTA1 like protein-domain-containing protein n=1 Tax=Epithele typhae TaxID=378194 RepID=UPI0020084D54|nr:RTA1 like protein-domain-containing protein [Epithele typhae]KAH9941797.1 RTA1 like protein-domain-containing protein [Epithele typhae]
MTRNHTIEFDSHGHLISPFYGYWPTIVCTIAAATPLVGALFISVGRLVTAAGEQYSRLSSRLYGRIFMKVWARTPQDFIALLAQCSGGALAGSDWRIPARSGIAFQLGFLIFVVLAAEYLWRFSNDCPIRPARTVEYATPHGPMEKPLKHLATGIYLMTLFLFIRAVYRTIELADGFDGRIIHTQVYFNVLDGAMVTLTMYTLNVLHTGRLLRAAAPRWSDKLPLRTEDGLAV